jgi:hypothetical protein
MIPRLPQLVAKGKFAASISGANALIRPVSELERTIAALDEKYPQNR